MFKNVNNLDPLGDNKEIDLPIVANEMIKKSLPLIGEIGLPQHRCTLDKASKMHGGYPLTKEFSTVMHRKPTVYSQPCPHTLRHARLSICNADWTAGRLKRTIGAQKARAAGD